MSIISETDLNDMAMEAARAGDEETLAGIARLCGVSTEALRLSAEAAVAQAPPPPDPPPAWKPFPSQVLPEPVRGFVLCVARAIQCDESFVALSLLSALAAAIGNTRRVELIPNVWDEPAIVWTAIIGESGSMKSPALEIALRPVRERQRKAMREHAEAMELFEREHAEHDRAMAQWRRSKTSEEPPAKPEEPIADRTWTDDTTTEALAAMLANQWRGLLLATDELSGLFASFDRYAQGRGGDAAKWLQMFGGRPLIVDRKTSGHVYVARAAVSACGGIQPGALSRAIGVEHRENGLLARFLLAMPPRKPKRWTGKGVPADAHHELIRLFDRLYSLQPAIGDDGEPRPVLLPLSADGDAAWEAFYNQHADEHARLTGDLAAAWSKLEGYAARFALVIHLIRAAANDPTLADPDAIDGQSIEAGVTLSRWFGHEAKRVYAALSANGEDRDRLELMQLIEAKGGSATARDLMTAKRSQYRTAADAEAALESLVSVGFGDWTAPKPGPAGGYPTKYFQLRAQHRTHNTEHTTPPDGVASGGSVLCGCVFGAGAQPRAGDEVEEL